MEGRNIEKNWIKWSSGSATQFFLQVMSSIYDRKDKKSLFLQVPALAPLGRPILFFFMPPTAYVNQVAMPTAGQNDHYCHIANLTVFTSNR